jgi:hypothetical protein
MKQLTKGDLEKIYNAFDNVFNETIQRIERIEKRQFSYDFFEDLDLGNYNTFFENSLNYIKNKIVTYDAPEVLKNGVKLLVQQSENIPFKEKKYNFLVFFIRSFGYSYSYINDTLETLKTIKGQTQNILDWLKLELY